MQFISASDESLRTQGRITATADGGQLWVYPYTQARFDSPAARSPCACATIGITAISALV